MGSTPVQIGEAGGRRTHDGWKLITSLVLDGISSRHTRRAYSQALDEFLIWFRDEPGREFNKATVQNTGRNWKPRAWRLPASTSGCLPSAAWPSKPQTMA